jgi:hypothetical protein
MPQAIRIWEIKDNTLYELPRPQINLEAKLEQWFESDISMIAGDFLVIGWQVRTDYDGYIDLLPGFQRRYRYHRAKKGTYAQRGYCSIIGLRFLGQGLIERDHYY